MRNSSSPREILISPVDGPNSLAKLFWTLAPKKLVVQTIASFVSGLTVALLLASIGKGLGSGYAQVEFPIFLLLVAGLVMARMVSSIAAANAGQDATIELRNRLCMHVLNVPLFELEQFGPSALLMALTTDIDQILGALLTIPAFVSNGVILVGCLTWFFWLSPFAFVVVVVVLVLGAPLYFVLIGRGTAWFAVSRERSEMVFEQLRSATEGIKELKLNASKAASFLADGLRSASLQYKEAAVRTSLWYQLAAVVGQSLFFLLMGIILLLARWRNTSHQIMLDYIVVLLYAGAPLETLLLSLPTFSRARQSLRKLQQIRVLLRATIEKPLEGAPMEVRERWQRVQLLDVRKNYVAPSGRGERATFTLGPMSLDIREGETLFITGGNGSGKTTLAKLITGLYSPDAGELRFGGEVVSDATRAWYMQHFSAIFSDFYLFDRLFGISAEALEGRVPVYMEQLGLKDYVQVRDGRFSTLRLSQGQRRRLALLVTLLEDRPICLFDEWAADQDSVFRRVFYHEILSDLHKRGKTIIVISHDERFFEVADRLIRLEEGKLVDEVRN